MLAQFVYEKGSWEIDTDRRELRAHGRAVPIGSRAFEIIEKLARSAGQFVTKDELVAHVWRGATVEENTLRVHVHAIRKALGPDRTLLKNAAGRGYRLIGLWTAKLDDDPDQAVRAPATPGDRVRSNLPASTSQLIGRARTLQQLSDLVSAFRVVTLTGAGGIGKTTLAVELARRLAAEFDDGVCFVELASLTVLDLVPSMVSAALGRKADSEVITAEVVARTIGTARLLLVLDNCEHVVEAAASLIETIVRQCPHVALLVTSREVMRVDGERVFRVPPLEVPDAAIEQQERLLGYSAVELFMARMQALDDRFSPAATNLPEVAAICARLDGIPLAIEFAASRAATFGVQQVAAGLLDRFGLLTSRRRTALPRHRTLRATLDWSYELLSEAERALLRKLAIFAGLFTVDDAQAIAAAPDTIEFLSDLVDKSLVVSASRDSATLYRLLETTRAYALEKVEASGELDAVARRHAEHYRNVFERTEAEWQVRPTSELHADHAWRSDNLRAALDWAYSGRGDASIGIALTAAAVPLWLHLSSHGENRGRVEQALALLPAAGTWDARREMKLHAALGSSSASDFPTKAEAAWERVLHLAREIGDVDHQLRSLWGLWVQRRKGAFDLAQQFCAIAPTPSDRLVGERMLAVSLHNLGNHNEARRYIERVVAGSSAMGASSTIIRFHVNQGLAAHVFRARILWVQGHPEQAMQAASRALEQAISVDHGLSTCHALAFAACPIALWAEDLERSQEYVGLLRDYAAKHAMAFWGAWSRCHQGVLDIKRGRAIEGTDLLRKSFDELRTGNRGFRVLGFLGELALGLGRAGKIEEATAAIGEAIDGADRTDERWIRPELLRIKGELLRLKEPGPPAGRPDACFRDALNEAQRQGALFWELRAATSLAGSLRDQGHRAEAAAVLRPVYERFTEGLEMPFLRSVRTLLGTL